MKQYKVKATYSIDVEYEVFADSEEAAISQFRQEDVRDILDQATIVRTGTEDESAELIYGEFTVKATDIDYEVNKEDVFDKVADEHPGLDEDSAEFEQLLEAEVKATKAALPKELTVTVNCGPDDLEDYVIEAISDETGWLVNDCKMETLSIE